MTPCRHVRHEGEVTVVDAVGRRGVELAGTALPGLVAAVAMGSSAVLLADRPVLAITVVVAGTLLALAVRRAFARQPLAWHLTPQGAVAVGPGRTAAVGPGQGRAVVPWNAVSEVAVVDRERPGATQTHRVRALELRDGDGRVLLRIGHTTRDAEHDHAVLEHLAARARALADSGGSA